MLSPIQIIAANRIRNDGKNYLIRWWCEKYRRPSNHPLLLSLTWEELYLEYTSDCLYKDPKQISSILGIEEQEWEGSTSDTYEKNIGEKLRKIPDIDLSRWQSTSGSLQSDEFDDQFEIDK